MFVKTKFDSIVNLANCDEIRLDIVSTAITIYAIIGDRNIEIIRFSKEMLVEAQKAYDKLFIELQSGETAYDIDDVIP